MADYPRIEIQNIDKLGLSYKKGAVRITFEVAPSPEVLRLMYLGASAQPLNVIIESPQAVMDLKITEVNIESGEVK